MMMPMTGRSTTCLIWVMSRTVLARMPTAPDCAAALAISGMTPPSFVYSGSCSSAWQETIRPPLIWLKICSWVMVVNSFLSKHCREGS